MNQKLNKLSLFFTGIFLSFIVMVSAHEGHLHAHQEALLTKWIAWIGKFHLIFLHFPIALITMALIAEYLYYKHPRYEIFQYSAQLMIVAAAIFAIFTVMLGFALGYGADYQGIFNHYYYWHMCLGCTTAILAWIAVGIRSLFYNQRRKVYFLSLGILFATLTFTGYFGGMMAFGSTPFWLPT